MTFQAPILLRDILRYRRPAFARTEEKFIRKVLLPFAGQHGCQLWRDGYHNLIASIGGCPDVLWSCHTDTVHARGGIQAIEETSTGFLQTSDAGSTCLGADDGAGIWIMLEMIAARRPGLYVFHREEEHGGKGSKWIAVNKAKLLKGIRYAVAFDRMGTSSIITHQGGLRTASDEFGNALAAKLGGAWKLDQTGSFTDTKSYAGLVPECTNLSVGYYSAHCATERLDVRHVMALRDLAVKLDMSGLPSPRDPKLEVYDRAYTATTYSGYGAGGYMGQRDLPLDFEVCYEYSKGVYCKGFWAPFVGFVPMPPASKGYSGQVLLPAEADFFIAAHRLRERPVNTPSAKAPKPTPAKAAKKGQPQLAIVPPEGADIGERQRIAKMARECPFAVADMMADYGISEDALVEATLERGYGRDW